MKETLAIKRPVLNIISHVLEVDIVFLRVGLATVTAGDCFDQADEQNCLPIICSSTQFQCANLK